MSGGDGDGVEDVSGGDGDVSGGGMRKECWWGCRVVVTYMLAYPWLQVM